MAGALIDTNTLGGGISFQVGQSGGAINSNYSFDLPLSSIAAFQNSALTFASNNTTQGQGFLGNVISNTGTQVNNTVSQAFNYNNSMLDVFHELNTKASDTAIKVARFGGSGGFMAGLGSLIGGIGTAAAMFA